MSYQYSISGQGHEVSVDGEISKDDTVRVTVDGEVHRISKADAGTYKSTPATCKLTTPNGCRIKETPATQKIQLPDGTSIKKTPGTVKATFPDGSSVKNSSDSSSSSFSKSINISIGNTSVSTSTDSDADTDSTEASDSTDDDSSVTIVEEEHTSEGPPSKRSVIQAITPDAGDILLVGAGLIFQSHFLLGIGLLFYASEAIPPAVRYLLSWLFSDSDTESEESTDTELERRIEAANEQYVNGDLTEEEYETHLDEIYADVEDVETDQEFIVDSDSDPASAEAVEQTASKTVSERN